MERLQSILLFRELRFPLKQIADIIDSPTFDEREAMAQQVHMLELEQKRLEGIIAHAKRLMNEKGFVMDFKPYDASELEAWKTEVRERWGDTDAFRESEERAAAGADFNAAAEALTTAFAELGALKGEDPASGAAQQKVSDIQRAISESFYTCTDEVLAGLGELYMMGWMTAS